MRMRMSVLMIGLLGAVALCSAQSPEMVSNARLAIPSAALPQTPTPNPNPSCTLPLDFCESGWSVSVFGNYSAVSNAPTNNGFESGAAFRLGMHWRGAIRYYQTASPSAKVLLAGPEYGFSAGHFLPSSANFDPTMLELFVHASPGLAWSSGTDASGNPVNGAKRFAFGVGGGADYTFPAAPNFQLRIVEVSYVHAGIFPNGGQFLGNHMQVASGLKLVFGGSTTPAVLARKAAHKRKVEARLQRSLQAVE